MGKKISRKRFIIQGAAGLAAVGALSSASLISRNPFFAPRRLGSTGLTVPPICFGATRVSEDAMVRFVIDNGLTFLDTGRAYANGNNERMVGRAIEGQREKVMIQSKIRLDPRDIQSGIDTRKGQNEIVSVLSKRLDDSLKALNTSYIDILLYHDASEESLLFHKSVIDFFSSKKSEGIIRAFGFSTHNDCLHLPERNNREGAYEMMMLPFNYKGSYVHSLNKTYNEWDQQRLLSILNEAHENGIGFIAMKTCSAGPYKPDNMSAATFPSAVDWVLNNDFVASAAVAMSNFSEINEHLEFFKP
jgi:aryl-alcohol dehydrogenase-like predicted oxidoreductase